MTRARLIHYPADPERPPVYLCDRCAKRARPRRTGDRVDWEARTFLYAGPLACQECAAKGPGKPQD